MTTTTKKMSVSSLVAAASEAKDEWIPATGETVELVTLHPSGSVDLKGTSLLYWDYGGAGQTLVWTSYFAQPISGDILAANSFVGNGVKTMAVVVKNDSLQSAYLSAAATFRVITA
jgi:hypothetical protein